MKLKKFPVFFVVFVVLALLACLFTVPTYAAEDKHPMEHGSSSEAAVSDEVDKTQGLDNRISTNFFMYIPAPPVSGDIPNMGDLGIDIERLLPITIGVGIAYLVCNRYANSVPKARKDS